MKKYSKKRLVVGLLCLLVGLIIFLYGALVVASSECPSCQTSQISNFVAFLIIMVSCIPILIGMAMSVREFERYIHGVK